MKGQLAVESTEVDLVRFRVRVRVRARVRVRVRVSRIDGSGPQPLCRWRRPRTNPMPWGSRAHLMVVGWVGRTE